jgi:hypothetical protein
MFCHLETILTDSDEIGDRLRQERSGFLWRSMFGPPMIVELKSVVITKGILQDSDSFLDLRLVEIDGLNSSPFPQLPPEEVDLPRVRAMSRA